MTRHCRRHPREVSGRPRFWTWAAAGTLVLISQAGMGASPGLAQEEKSSLGDLLPAIVKSLGEKVTDVTGPLKKALEGTGKKDPSRFTAPGFPASPGSGGTTAPARPTPPAIANPRARAIHIAQGHLNKLGYNAGPVDGKMRPRTRKAIRAFQTSRGVQATGRMSAALLKELGKSAEQTKASDVKNGAPETGKASAGCVIPKALQATLKGVQPLGAGSYRRVKPGRYRVTARQALGTGGRKHYVRPGDIIDVQLGAKKAGWRIGGPIICQDGVAIGVAYRGKGFFAGNGKKRVFVPVPKGRS